MHQPHFLPSVQYFSRMARADVFFFADNVQHKRGHWEHKNRVLLQGKPRAVALRLSKASAFSQIDEITLFQPDATIRKITATLYHAYRHCKGWPLVDALCQRMTERARIWKNLADCNIELTELLTKQLSITVPLHRWSDHPVEASEGCDIGWRSERIARYAEMVAATHFLYGPGTASYLESAAFERRGIALVPDHWRPRAYAQPSDAFVANLSIVDLLARRPEDAVDYLGDSG